MSGVLLAMLAYVLVQFVIGVVASRQMANEADYILAGAAARHFPGRVFGVCLVLRGLFDRRRADGGLGDRRDPRHCGDGGRDGRVAGGEVYAWISRAVSPGPGGRNCALFGADTGGAGLKLLILGRGNGCHGGVGRGGV